MADQREAREALASGLFTWATQMPPIQTVRCWTGLEENALRSHGKQQGIKQTQ